MKSHKNYHVANFCCSIPSYLCFESCFANHEFIPHFGSSPTSIGIARQTAAKGEEPQQGGAEGASFGGQGGRVTGLRGSERP